LSHSYNRRSTIPTIKAKYLTSESEKSVSAYHRGRRQPWLPVVAGTPGRWPPGKHSWGFAWRKHNFRRLCCPCQHRRQRSTTTEPRILLRPPNRHTPAV